MQSLFNISCKSYVDNVLEYDIEENICNFLNLVSDKNILSVEQIITKIKIDNMSELLKQHIYNTLIMSLDGINLEKNLINDEHYLPNNSALFYKLFTYAVDYNLINVIQYYVDVFYNIKCKLSARFLSNGTKKLKVAQFIYGDALIYSSLFSNLIIFFTKDSLCKLLKNEKTNILTDIIIKTYKMDTGTYSYDFKIYNKSLFYNSSFLLCTDNFPVILKFFIDNDIKLNISFIDNYTNILELSSYLMFFEKHFQLLYDEQDKIDCENMLLIYIFLRKDDEIKKFIKTIEGDYGKYSYAFGSIKKIISVLFQGNYIEHIIYFINLLSEFENVCKNQTVLFFRLNHNIPLNLLKIIVDTCLKQKIKIENSHESNSEHVNLFSTEKNKIKINENIIISILKNNEFTLFKNLLDVFITNKEENSFIVNYLVKFNKIDFFTIILKYELDLQTLDFTEQTLLMFIKDYDSIKLHGTTIINKLITDRNYKLILIYLKNMKNIYPFEFIKLYGILCERISTKFYNCEIDIPNKLYIPDSVRQAIKIDPLQKYENIIQLGKIRDELKNI